MSLVRYLIAGTAAVTLIASAAWAQDCQPSKWGADDEIGAANLVTPERVLAAMKLVKLGKTSPLGVVVDSKTPAYPPRALSNLVVQPGQQAGTVPFPNGGTYNDDIFTGWLGIGSQIDGLGHVGVKNVYYNCNKAADFAALTGLTKLGTHNIPPIVTRGVMLDIAKLKGKQSLDAGELITRADVEAAEKAQGVTISEGDVVLFNTGWTEHVLPSDPAKWGAGEPGIAADATAYLVSKNVIAVGADTWGLDPIPPEKADDPFHAHIVLLQQNGIYILETMNTAPLAAEGVSEFMFVLGQPRIRGTVQAMINPVAIW